MRVAVIPNCKTVCGTEAGRIASALEACGAEVRLPDSALEFPRNAQGELLDWGDVIVALGGDGTILHVAKRAAARDKPVLGINCGKLGFMAGLEADELERLDDLIAGRYHIERRMMLEVRVRRKSGEDLVMNALNEVVVSRGARTRMIELEIGSGRESMLTYNADGVIVASPTGSTAYSLSAGGPVVDPQLACMLVTPICPHSLHARSHIFHEDASLQVRVHLADADSGRAHAAEVLVTIDGEEGVPIEGGDTVHVSRAAAAARLIKIKEIPFYDLLNQKLTSRR